MHHTVFEAGDHQPFFVPSEAKTYPDPRTPEEVRDLLGPTEQEHQSEAI